MKNRLLLIIANIFLLSCSSTDPKKEQEEISGINSIENYSGITSSEASGPTLNQTMPSEYLEWETIKINNILSLDANIRDVEAIFGKPDSTVTPDYANICPNCHFCWEETPPYKDTYYKGVEFEQLNDSLVFWSADLTLNKNLFLQSGKIRFDHKTTLEEVRKYFPEAVKEAEKDDSGAMIRISPSKHPVDGAFILMFNREGYLINFHFWFPC